MGNIKEKDKELLWCAICSKLPYGLYVKTTVSDKVGKMYLCHKNEFVMMQVEDDTLSTIVGIEHARPYLRSLDKMTKKEQKAYSKYAYYGNVLGDWSKSIMFLNKHFFDYNGLIKKGLALEAEEGMYNFK